MIKKILNWIKNIFKPTRQEKVVELTEKQQKILRKHKGDLE
mgnify:CR=1 FL=1|jgi:hypothetical protein|tara:strand:+ start:450 stop:572 length:123 start_codon:yes stop_codon:yes gene_type:complete